MPRAFFATPAALCLATVLGACAALPQPESSSEAPPAAAATVTESAPDTAAAPVTAPASATPAAVATASADVAVIRPAAAATPAPAPGQPRITVVLPTEPGAIKAAVQASVTRASKPAPVTAAVTAQPAMPRALAPVKSRESGKGRTAAKAASPLASPDLWVRMRGRMALADIEHPRITEQLETLKRQPGYLNLFTQRARPYLHYIVENIDRRGLPMDLALLPMVESAFDPTALSPKDAAGLWQIIPSTGQEWGLLLAEGYDGRLDIHTSTGVALRYLRYLNQQFNGDWLLALAAYNAGPRAVQDAIKARATEAAPVVAYPGLDTQPLVHEALATAGAADAPAISQSLFWSLKLPKETQDYVPRIVALAHVVANPGAYGLKLPVIDNQPYLYRVDLTADSKVIDSVTAAGIPMEDFSRFNPGFKQGVEPPARAYNLLLPREQAQTLVASAPGAQLVAPSRYTVRKGETLAAIARRHGVPSGQLAQWNGLNDRVALKAGQQLIVYPSS